MTLELTQAQFDAMVGQALQEAPLECCGLIGGAGDRTRRVYRARNELQSRARYRIHPEDMYRAWREIEVENGWEIIGFYHSHPMSDAYPSPTDVADAVESGYSEVSRFVIVSLVNPERPVVRSFWLKQGKVVEEPLTIVSDDAGEEP